MKYRAYRHAGKVLDRIDSTESDEFGVPAEVAVADVAEALGVLPEEITVLVSTDVPVPEVVIPPAPDSTPTDLDMDAIDAVLAKADTDVTAAEVKALVLRVARRLRNRNRL